MREIKHADGTIIYLYAAGTIPCPEGYMKHPTKRNTFLPLLVDCVHRQSSGDMKQKPCCGSGPAPYICKAIDGLIYYRQCNMCKGSPEWAKQNIRLPKEQRLSWLKTQKL